MARLKLDIEAGDLSGHIRISGDDNHAGISMENDNTRIFFHADKQILVSLATSFLIAAQKLEYEKQKAETP